MKQLIFAFTLLALNFSCTRIVEYEDPFPTEVNFCECEPFYLGTWVSDSVWVTTTIDSNDSSFTNRAPGITYIMTLRCDETSLLQIDYVTFANVRTMDLKSSNYKASASNIEIFGQLDSTLIEAEFTLNIKQLTDSAFNASYSRNLGNGQNSLYQIFYRKS